MSRKIIKQNSPLSFMDCSSCGARCCQSNLIYASLYDIEKVTELFSLFFMIQNHKISLVYFFYYGEKEGEHCPYLQNDLCSVYEKRPYACRSYPFSHQSSSIYYSTTCPHIVESQESGMKFIEDKKINPAIFNDFVTEDFLQKQDDVMKKSEEFVRFCNQNDLLIPYEKFYAGKELYMNFKPSMQKQLYCIHPFKVAALRLSGKKLFEGKGYFLSIIQKIIAAQRNIEKLYLKSSL
ncbi:YkgJ family cysteine cluster protein [Sulfurimonas sp. NWX79]|uniref:YkgJ family cysteine cluster protein n=1 Tax=Sulfurimonas sp. NWX79 TaxID=2925412 RepID=UPI003204B42A